MDGSTRISAWIPQEDKRFLERLIKSGTYRGYSDIVRVALSDFIAKYTNRPTMQSLDDQLKRLRFRMDKYDEHGREVNKRLHELESER